MTKSATAVAAAAALLFGTSAFGYAQSPGDTRRGRELSARLCINCHAIDRISSDPVLADVPSFPSIADRVQSTPEYIAGRIIIPHPAMPGVSLTAAEIRDIVAYIISLRSPD
jgi:mono/diheme cytochrome c family protein